MQVLSPPDLIASKVVSLWQRRGKAKSFTDRRDVMLLLLAFPDLKSHPGPVTDCLLAAEADSGTIRLWEELVNQEIAPESEDDDF